MKDNLSLVKALEQFLPLLKQFEEGIAWYEVLDLGKPDEATAAQATRQGLIPGAALGRKLKIVDCNQVYVKHSGRSKEDLLGKDPYSFFKPTDVKDLLPLLTGVAVASPQKPYSGYFQWKRPDQKLNWIKFSAIPISEGEKNYVLGLYTDITDQVIAQDKLQLFCAYQSRAVHDFRSPAVGIISWAKHIRQWPEELHKGLTHIEKSAHRLMDLSNFTLDYTKSFSGQMEIKYDWASLDDIEEILDAIYAIQVSRKTLRWVVAFPREGKRLQILTDELRFTQILQNLISNALKFTQKGEIQVNCTLLGGLAPSKGIEITVKDTGMGIAPEDHQKIFEPYMTLRTSTEGEKGHGLGLTTTKELVQALNGSITLISQLEKGTTFTVSFPQMEYRFIPPSEEKLQ